MTRVLDSDKRELLESLIDQSSVSEVLWALGLICSEKADHLRESWSDNKTADDWDKIAGLVVDCQGRLYNNKLGDV